MSKEKSVFTRANGKNNIHCINELQEWAVSLSRQINYLENTLTNYLQQVAIENDKKKGKSNVSKEN